MIGADLYVFNSICDSLDNEVIRKFINGIRDYNCNMLFNYITPHEIELLNKFKEDSYVDICDHIMKPIFSLKFWVNIREQTEAQIKFVEKFVRISHTTDSFDLQRYNICNYHFT